MNSPSKEKKPGRFKGWLFLLLGVVLVSAMVMKTPPSKPAGETGKFSEVWTPYTFHPDVSVSTYESKAGGATVVWLSGMSENYGSDRTPFGEIWQVYTFRPEITATAYDSDGGEATVIWIDGIDDASSL